jgi:hypothetical protein
MIDYTTSRFLIFTVNKITKKYWSSEFESLIGLMSFDFLVGWKSEYRSSVPDELPDLSDVQVLNAQLAVLNWSEQKCTEVYRCTARVEILRNRSNSMPTLNVFFCAPLVLVGFRVPLLWIQPLLMTVSITDINHTSHSVLLSCSCI